MEKISTEQARSIGTSIRRNRNDRKDKLGNGYISILPKDIANIVISSLGFFIGRAVVFDTLNPLAPAFLANFCGTGYRFYLTAALTAIGFFTKLNGFYLTKYLICVVLLGLFQFIAGRKFKKIALPLQCAATGTSLFLAGTITMITNEFGSYFILLCLLESILAVSLTFVLKKGILVLDTGQQRKALGNEEIISVAILSGAVIAGAAQIYIGSISLKYFFSFLIILIAGHKGGSALGTLTGMLLGLTLYFSGFASLETLTVFSLSGACAGAPKEFGKHGAIISMSLGILTGAYFIDRSLLSIELLLSVLSSSILFLALPDYFYFNIGAAINPYDNTEEYLERIKDLTTGRLKSFSDSFEKLAKTFAGLAEKKNGLNQKDISRLIDDVAAKTCSYCDINRNCWENDFYNTYQTIFGMLGDCEQKGCVKGGDWPDFAKTCKHFASFVENMNRYFDLYKTNLVWHNRIVESRELVAQQLTGVSGVIGRLADDLDFELVFKEDLEESLRMELLKNKVEVNKLIVLENKEGKYEVTFQHKACYGQKRHKDILKATEKVLGKRMTPQDKNCNIDGKSGYCRMKLLEEQKYRFTVGMARKAKTFGKDSGDSYSFMEMKNGQCLMALSDGMGSGKKARDESAAAIGLLEDFIESGFEKELAVKMINSVLVLKSSEESFSTLDICSIDLYTGEGEFIKIGAASTFLLRGGQVQVVKSSSLPIGILNTVDLEVSIKKLRDNDMIIMVTDGILDSGMHEDGEEWMAEILRGLPCANPQDLAEHILAEAQAACRGESRDDMTVLVGKLWQKV